METPGNVKTASRTTIYYEKGYKPEADYLKQRRLKQAVVAPAPSSFSANLTVVLGTDFEPSS
jgi:trehalose 6-phosphate phosphatase